MRILVYVLVLANLLFFGWAQWLDSPAQVASGRADARVQPAAAAAAAAAAGKSASRCLTFGPLTEAAQVYATSAALTARGLGSQLRQTQRQVSDGWLVFVGGLGSPAVRLGARKRLNAAGIQDVGSVAGQAGSDRISVGLFSEHDGALKRAAEVEAAHVTPTIEEHQRNVTERWLNVEFSRDAKPPLPAELGITASGDGAPNWVECPVPASSG